MGWLRSDAQLLCFLPKLGIQTCKAATIIADGGPRFTLTSAAAAKGNTQGHIHYLTIFSKNPTSGLLSMLRSYWLSYY